MTFNLENFEKKLIKLYEKCDKIDTNLITIDEILKYYPDENLKVKIQNFLNIIKCIDFI